MPMTTEGYTPRTAQQWYERMKARFDDMCSDIGVNPPRWERQEFVNLIVTAMAVSVSEIDEAVSGIQDARSIINASGAFLRELAILVGLQVDDGTRSTVTLSVTAWAQSTVILPKGSRAQGGGTNGDANWRTTEDVTIPAGTTVTVTAESEDIGPVSAASAMITRRLDGVSGWTTVTNASAATPGTSPETDSEIRARIVRGSFAAGSRSGLALRDRLVNVDGVKAARVLFNSSMTDTTVSNRTVPAGGMAVWVWPATINDAAKTSALSAIYGHKDGSAAISYPATTGADGVKGSLVGADNLEKNVGFWWVQDNEVKVRVTVSTFEAGYTSVSQVTANVQAAVQAYFDSLSPGDAIRQNDLVGLVAASAGVARATVELLAEDDPYTAPAAFTGSYSTNDVAMEAGLIGVQNGITEVL